MSSFFSLSLLAVIVAALLDIVANLLLAKSQGFRRKFIGFASLGMVGLALGDVVRQRRNLLGQQGVGALQFRVAQQKAVNALCQGLDQ